MERYKGPWQIWRKPYGTFSRWEPYGKPVPTKKAALDAISDAELTGHAESCEWNILPEGQAPKGHDPRARWLAKQ
jgi:hypothetical protein